MLAPLGGQDGHINRAAHGLRIARNGLNGNVLAGFHPGYGGLGDAELFRNIFLGHARFAARLDQGIGDGKFLLKGIIGGLLFRIVPHLFVMILKDTSSHYRTSFARFRAIFISSFGVCCVFLTKERTMTTRRPDTAM